MKLQIVQIDEEYDGTSVIACILHTKEKHPQGIVNQMVVVGYGDDIMQYVHESYDDFKILETIKDYPDETDFDSLYNILVDKGYF